MITTPHKKSFKYPVLQEYVALGLDPNKIQALYMFDSAGNLYDASGNKSHGDISTSSGFSGTGRYGTGMYFDGVDDYVTIPDLDDSGANLSVSTWFRKEVTGGYAYIVHTDDAGNQIAWTMAFDGQNKMEIALSDTGISNVKIYTTPSVIPLFPGWFHFVWTWGSSTLKLYVNGVEVVPVITGDDPMTNIFNSTADIHIGTGWSGGVPAGGPFNGHTDSLLITKETLNPTQIANIYKAGL